MVISSPDHFFLCRLAFCRLRYLCFDIFFRRFLIKEPNSNLSTELQRKQPRSNPTAADEYRLANRAENRKLRTAYTPPAMRPIIGITSRQPFVETSGGQLRAHVVNEVYTAAVIRSGGTPILFPPVDPDEAPRLIDRLDGLVLSGGGDIDPALYGGKYFESMYMIDDFRDRFEFALVDEARSRRMPVLAICRGLQVVNVALGGSLIEDILSELGSSDHTVRGPGVVDCHQTVTIEAGTLVAEAIGSTEACVNSIHHQAVRRVAPGLRAAGWASDGVVEVLDPEDHTWPLLAVQWHPEYLAVKDDPASLALFHALVENAAARTAS